jgi:hypothetical protein
VRQCTRKCSGQQLHYYPPLRPDGEIRPGRNNDTMWSTQVHELGNTMALRRVNCEIHGAINFPTTLNFKKSGRLRFAMFLRISLAGNCGHSLSWTIWFGLAASTLNALHSLVVSSPSSLSGSVGRPRHHSC